jgi:hypothetical protein
VRVRALLEGLHTVASEIIEHERVHLISSRFTVRARLTCERVTPPARAVP